MKLADAYAEDTLEVLRRSNQPLSAADVAEALSRRLSPSELAAGRTVSSDVATIALRALVDRGLVKSAAVKRDVTFRSHYLSGRPIMTTQARKATVYRLAAKSKRKARA